MWNKSRIAIIIFMIICLPCSLWTWGEESPGRGLIALEREDGSIYLGWRSLKEDPEDMRFTLSRTSNDSSDSKQIKINDPSTNFVDSEVEKGKTYIYQLFTNASSSPTPLGEIKITPQGKAQDFIKIPLEGDYDFQKIGIGDLDGDGEFEYLIKQPNFNTDPYQQPGYWKRSPLTYKIEAYRLDGTMMWRYDMGWAIEAGIWYSPWMVYDVDQDGKAEVYCKAGEGDPREPEGHVKTGPEYLVKLDGETGEIVKKTDWITREGYQDYNRSCRNFLTVAYLDGKSPSLIMQRGTYRLIRMRAMNSDFDPIWNWETDQGYEEYRGQSSHGLITADVDQDGKDELVMGAAVIDDNGKGLWSLKMGHPDICYVADIDPDHPGLEVYYGFESRQDTDGICLVDAKTGKKLWTHKEPTKHIHNQGMVADVLAEYPGMETYSGERDYPERFFYSSKGELIETFMDTSLSPRPLWWDDDPQKEVIWGRTIQDWKGKEYTGIEGRVIAIMDCLGDHREELITSVKGEIRIYTTTIPSKERKTCLLQDHQYRLGVVAQTMGYYYPAQLGAVKK